MQPLISIVIPCFNASSTIIPTLRSVQNQTLDRFEVVCIDDASSDNTAELIRSFADQDKRFHYLPLSINHGVHQARAQGVTQCNSPWIGFLDSDDWMKPTMLERLVAAANEVNADIVLCGSRRVSASGRFIEKKVAFPRREVFEHNIFQLFCSQQFGTGALWNKLYKASLIKKWAVKSHRWQQNGVEDTIVNIGCFWDANRVITIPDILHYYVQAPGSLTANPNRETRLQKILMAYASAISLYADLGPTALAGITNLYRSQLDYDYLALPLLDDFPQWRPGLADSLQFLAQEYPEALALLVARTSPTRITYRRITLRKILYQLANTIKLPRLGI